MKHLYRSYFLFFIFLLSTSISGCLTETQNPAYIFTSGQLPQILEDQANPKVDVPLSSSGNTKLAVAVIDNGVDYTNPLLKNRIRFTRDQSDQIIGAGYDFLGNDNFPHPNQINPSLFAFGAQGITDQKIVGELQDPESLLLFFNTKFMTQLLAEIKKSPELKSSLFGEKITEKSMDVAFAHTLIHDEIFEPEYYEDARSAYQKELDDIASGTITDEEIKKETYGQCVRHIRKSEMKNSDCLNAIKKRYSIAEYKSIFENSHWIMDANKGAPILSFDGSSYDITQFYYYIEFYQAVKKAYESVQAEFEKAYQPLYEYKYALAIDKTDKQSFDDENMKLLHTYIYHSFFGNTEKDPLAPYRLRFCKNLNEEQYSTFHSLVATDVDKKAILRETIASLFSTSRNIEEYLETADFVSQSDKNTYAKQRKNSAKMELYLKTALVNRGVEGLSCDLSLATKGRFWGEYSDLFEAAHGRYLNAASHSISHGSHVSGIVAAQDKDIEIVPVRVITSTPDFVKSVVEKSFSTSMQDLRTWLKFPAVRKMVASKYQVAFDLQETPTEEKWDKVYSILYSRFSKELESKQMDYLFIDQIIEAIQYIGENKIKIANMSLGTNFAKEVQKAGTGTQPTEDDAITSLLIDLLKYRVGVAIKKYAQNTLFVIAAGNEGNWIDGISRSALPCDISSPEIGAYKELGVLPNNEIDNILCVGSLSHNGDFSSFTNILLTDTPMIFATGEAIKSTMKTTDCTGADQIFTHALGETPTYPFFSSFDDNHIKMLKDLGIYTAKENEDSEEEEERIEKTMDNLNARLSFEMSELLDVGQKHFCLRRYYTNAQLSGTSMASPGTAGFIASWLLDKMKQSNLSEEMVWDDPEFTPVKIIANISAESPKIGTKVLKTVKVKELKDFEELIEAENKTGLEEGETKFLFTN